MLERAVGGMRPAVVASRSRPPLFPAGTKMGRSARTPAVGGLVYPSTRGQTS